MWPYWLMFLVPATVAAILRFEPKGSAGNVGSVRERIEWLCLAVVLWLTIGFRHEVGGDWGNYLRMLSGVELRSLREVFLLADPGYQLVSWISLRAGWQIYGVNLFCGGIFIFGLVQFCRTQPRPWLALAVAVPYLVIVVAMGYTRQSVAIGLAMLGLVALMRGETRRFVLFVFLAGTFHKTVVLLLPIAGLASSKNRYWTTLWALLVFIAAYFLFLQESVESMYALYIEEGMQSQGALIRLLMNAVPAAIWLFWGRRFHFSVYEAALWRWFAIISLAMFVALWVTPSSTVLDRFALYFAPLQLIVFSRLPGFFSRAALNRRIIISSILLYYAAVQFVWLNLGDHAHAWIPYSFYPLELL